MKYNVLSLVAGVILGAALVLILLGISAFFKFYSDFGKPIIYFDNQARDTINRNGFTLSPSITDPYYFITGFQDHIEFVAFSGPREVLDNIVEKKTGKKISGLSAWKNQVAG